MKKTIAIIGITGIFCSLLYLNLNKAIQIKSDLPDKTKLELKQIPEFEFESMENTYISSLDLETGISTVIIHFSPSCDFCDEEAKIISNYYHEFEKSQVLFVSNHSKKSIKKFQEKHSLDIYPNVYFLQYKKINSKNCLGLESSLLFLFSTPNLIC